MGKQLEKDKKLSRKARRKAARRRQAIKNAVIFWGLLALCLGSLAAMRLINREPERQNTWYVQNGGVEIAAPPMSDAGLMTAVGRASTAAGNPAGTREAAETALPQSRREQGGVAPESMPDAAQTARPAETATAQPTNAPTAAPSSTPTAEPQPSPSPASEPVTITITAAGDCTLGGNVNSNKGRKFSEMVEEKGYDYFFDNVRDVFEADDLTIVNLEGPLTDVGMARTETSFCFKGKPEYVKILMGSSVELCNMANNHSRDFGIKGLKRTAEVLDWAGIGYCGYSKIYATQIKGVRICALGYDKWNCSREDILNTVAAVRQNCDILIVNMHWGKELNYSALPEQSSLGHAIIDAGADLVIGTHPHVYGGVELYKGKYIVYSLGNFCFGGNTLPADMRCMMFQQTFEVYPNGVWDGGINVIPCYVSSNAKKNNYQPTILPASQGLQLLKEISGYSNFTQDGTVWMKGSYAETSGMLDYVSVLPTLQPEASARRNEMMRTLGIEAKPSAEPAETADEPESPAAPQL